MSDTLAVSYRTKKATDVAQLIRIFLSSYTSKTQKNPITHRRRKWGWGAGGARAPPTFQLGVLSTPINMFV